MYFSKIDLILYCYLKDSATIFGIIILPSRPYHVNIEIDIPSILFCILSILPDDYYFENWSVA
jgi:hypothetical protein